MADDLIARALIALEQGNVGSAVAANKALGYVIVRDDRHDLTDDHREIHDSINDLINKAGTHG